MFWLDTSEYIDVNILYSTVQYTTYYIALCLIIVLYTLFELIVIIVR